MENKTGTIYLSSKDMPNPILPTKNGYEQFVIRPIKLDQSWIAVNNVSRRDWNDRSN